MALLDNRWIILFGGFLLNLMLGVVYSWSVFINPLMDDYGWSKLTASLPFMIFLAVFALLMIPAGRFQDKLGPRKIAMFGGLLLGAGFMLASLQVDSVTTLCLTYGLIAGGGCGLGYACAIPVARKWFPDKPGLAIGITVGGFGLSALLFAPLQKSLIADQGIDSTFLIIGGVLMAVSILASALLKNPPAGWKPAGWEPKVTAAASAVKSIAVDEDLGAMAVLKTPRFWMLWFVFTFMALAGLMVIGHIASYTDGLQGVTVGALAAGVLSGFNAAGRPGSGWLADKFGYAKTMMILFAIQAIVLLIFPFVAVNAALVFVLVIFIGFNFGANFALFPTACGDSFGVKNMGRNYGLLFTAYGVGGIVGPLIGGQVYDSTGDYKWAFIIAAILVFVAVAIVFTYRKKYS
ncbi:MAG: OFA family MFS transporter [Chloroflexota bacterium]|nr:OFA family MFS transporter [Chloroflexota bacterium]